jgi:hypothetical protein
MRRVLIIAVTILFCGAGCGLDQKIDWKLPFLWNPLTASGDAAAAARSIELKPGLSFIIRPSVLGVSGTVDQVFGLDENSLNVRVKEAGPDRRTIEWQETSATGTDVMAHATSTLSVCQYADAQAMILPAFWQAGQTTASKNGGLWLSRSAFDGLIAGQEVDWRIGLADNALGAISRAFSTFNELSTKYFGSATVVPEISPFTVKKTGTADAFPLMIDGRLVLLRTLQASSWFADFVILDNAENPLILKVSVHPAAAPALKALEPARLRWEELGYEITSLARP